MRIVLIIACLITMSSQAFAESSPPWMRGDMPAKSNSSYYFKVVQGTGVTTSEARNNAIYGLVSELARSQGVSIKGTDLLESLTRSDNGNYNEQTRQQSSFTIERDAFKASFEMVDEYLDKDRTLWVLFEVAHNPEKVTFDKVEFTTNYGARAVLRSAIVPGWGQMHKRSFGKGITILSLQVASVAGVFVCDNLSSSYYNKALAERDNGVREQYQDRSSSYRNIRNVFIAAAGAIYVYNIVDVLAAKGAKRYKLGVSPSGVTFSMKL